MKTILDGNSRRVGAIFNEIDTNFIEVCNSILRIAYPTYTLRGYAEMQPAAPSQGDCFLVKENATVWGIACQKDHVLLFNAEEWEILEYKITEINQSLQNAYFTASQITVEPIVGLNAATVQHSLAVITAALLAAGIMTPFVGIGSMAIGDTFIVG